jgi:hypothetical protein
MAHAWHRVGSSWERSPLSGVCVALADPAGAPCHPAEAPRTTIAPAMLRRYGPAPTPVWVLLTNAACPVRVNGEPLLAGLRVLHDRDEILIGTQAPLYYSTEELARVEPFPGGEDAVFCARCRQPIQAGTSAVRCPACGHWCEQSEIKPCWTYGPTCPLCDQATAFNAGLRWTPEEL